MKRGLIALGFLIAGMVGWVLILTACAVSKPQGPPAEKLFAVPAERWPSSEYAAMAARGKDVFARQCVRCHTVNGLANVPAPDLSDYGSEGWSHLRTADFIVDPQRYYPGTKMPSFGEKYAKSKDEALTDQQINDVTAYISSLKKQAYYLPENQRQ